MKTKKTKAKKLVNLNLRLPLDLIDFYKEVGKFAGVSTAKAILVVVGIDIVKARKEKRLSSK